MNDMKYITEKDISLLFDFARKEANQALMENEVPIGSVIFNKDINEIIGSSHNRVQLNNNPFDHAEIIALREAMIKTNRIHLDNSILIVTLEPCLMCFGALLNAGIKEVYYSVRSIEDGAFTKYQMDNCIESHFIPSEKDSNLIKSFFKNIR